MRRFRMQAQVRGVVFGGVFALGVLAAGGAWGQDGGGQMKLDELNSSSGMVPSGNTHGFRSNHEFSPYTFAHTGNLPEKNGEQDEVSFRPHADFRAAINANPYKNMYREMITKALPVLFSTGFMVENGGFTGTSNAIQAALGMMQTELNASSFELALRGVNGHDSQKRFANRIYRVMEANQGGGGYLYTTGLLGATGDKIEEPLDQTKEKVVDPGQIKGKGIKITDHLPSNQSGQSQGQGQGQGQQEWNLIETLFSNQNGSSSSNSDRDQKVKQWMLEVVGNFIVQPDNSASQSGQGSAPFQRNKLTFVRPTKKASISQSGGGAATASLRTQNQAQGDIIPQEVFGIAPAFKEERKEVWDKLVVILQSYCQFKLQNENSGQDARNFSKKFSSKVVADAGRSFTETSSNRLKISITLLDSFFKMWVQLASDPQQPTKLQCSFADSNNQMPDKFEANDNADENFGDNVKNSRQNKFLWMLADILARDRTLDNLRASYEVAMQKAMASDASVGIQLNKLFCAAVGNNSSATFSESQCDVLYNFEAMAVDNQRRWNILVDEVFKLAQSISASSNFRFDPNHSLNTAGGSADSAGDADGGGEGGGE
jgi:hypothetical protein